MSAERKYEEKRLPADIAVGKRLKIVRKALNIEQLELAQVVGYSGAAGISHLETGLRGINMDLLKKIAEAFDMDPRVLGMFLLDDDGLTEEEVTRIVRYSKLLKKTDNPHLQTINKMIDVALENGDS